MAAIKIHLSAIVDLQPCLTGNRLKKNPQLFYPSIMKLLVWHQRQMKKRHYYSAATCKVSSFFFIPRWNFTYDHHPWSRKNPPSNEKSGFQWKLPNLSKENGKRRVHVLVLNYKIQNINLTICIKYHRIIYF